MPALEQAQYELKEARREILKLEKSIKKRDVLVSDVLRENLELKSELEALQQRNTYLESSLKRPRNTEVDTDV